jgi:nucleotide-binding universal stress UspA family protein
MSYRSLLVHLDPGPLAGARCEAAIRLAADFDCHLLGVAPTGLVYLPASPDAAMPLLEYAELAMQALREQAGQATQAFRDACGAARLASFEAFIDEADAAASLVRHAQCSDLTVLTQADPDASDHRAARALVEQVVLHSARPTLVLPYAGRIAPLGSTVLAAWDDSREAARALSDALPLLRRAGKVHVVRWNESRADDSDEALRARLEPVHRWLQRHGVAAEMHVEAGEVGVGDAMLSRASDLGADLIVMGAYGHARWAERMLGGATRGLLASMTVPVLMSH